MRAHCDAGCRQAWSGLLWRRVQGNLPLSSHCSIPVMKVPTVRPFLNHCLKLRALFSSACSHEDSKALA
ncbi:Uncharacterised protein [Bordetella pertussis]|nr:Uncharacterised protein [Bordetella pertussis]CFP64924.1 Uncharacterised protein [Bordetella pertussis]CFW31734.1 Uncharacterised protein [Bordetella pertussis]